MGYVLLNVEHRQVRHSNACVKRYRHLLEYLQSPLSEKKNEKKVLFQRKRLMLWYGLGRPVITSEIGNWSVFVLLAWRFVFGIIMK